MLISYSAPPGTASVFPPAANLRHPHSQKPKRRKPLPHRKPHLQVPVHDVMLVDVTDALQDLIDAVAGRDRRARHIVSAVAQAK